MIHVMIGIQFLSLFNKLPVEEIIVVLFDEISWMVRGYACFVEKLKFWLDQKIVVEKNVFLMFCGSVLTKQ